MKNEERKHFRVINSILSNFEIILKKPQLEIKRKDELGNAKTYYENAKKTDLLHLVNSLELLITTCTKNLISNNKTSQFLDGGNVLHYICFSNDLKLLEYVLSEKKEININKTNSKGYTAFHVAVIFGTKEMIKILLKNNNLNKFIKNKDGYDALFLSIIHGKFEKFRLLIEDEEMCKKSKDNHNRNIIHFCCYTKRSECLKEIPSEFLININPNEIDKTKHTPLHLAVYKKDKQAIEILFSLWKEEIKPNEQDNKGWTPLHLAVYYKDKEIIQLLFSLWKEEIKPNEQDNKGWTPLHLAVYYKDKEIIQLLFSLWNLNCKLTNEKDENPLHTWLLQDFKQEKLSWWNFWSYNSGIYVEIVDLLLKHDDTIINDKINTGFTALNIVCNKNTYIDDDFEVISKLIHYKANPNIPDNNNNTPLHNLAAKNKIIPNLFNFLLKSGSEINSQNKDKQTALHILLSKKPTLENIEYLLKNGANPNLKDIYDKTALMYGLQYSQKIEINKLLLKKSNNDIWNVVDIWDKNCLYYAVSVKDIEMVELLFAKTKNKNLALKKALTLVNETDENCKKIYKLFYNYHQEHKEDETPQPNTSKSKQNTFNLEYNCECNKNSESKKIKKKSGNNILKTNDNENEKNKKKKKNSDNSNPKAKTNNNYVQNANTTAVQHNIAEIQSYEKEEKRKKQIEKSKETKDKSIEIQSTKDIEESIPHIEQIKPKIENQLLKENLIEKIIKNTYFNFKIICGVHDKNIDKPHHYFIVLTTKNKHFFAFRGTSKDKDTRHNNEPYNKTTDLKIKIYENAKNTYFYFWDKEIINLNKNPFISEYGVWPTSMLTEEKKKFILGKLDMNNLKLLLEESQCHENTKSLYTSVSTTLSNITAYFLPKNNTKDKIQPFSYVKKNLSSENDSSSEEKIQKLKPTLQS